MQYSESLVHAYPTDEQNLFFENQKLQDSLISCFKQIETPEERKWTESFVTDGFYPYYTKQKVKVLYIGKESLGIGGCDYIDVLMDSIKKNDPRGTAERKKDYPHDVKKVLTNDNDPFHSKILYLTYGLNHGCLEYKDMPWASEIGTTGFAVDGGISFAFMNFSKFDNPSESSFRADNQRMNLYCEMSERTGRNWHEAQISLLEPDIIISMNISEWIARVFKKSVWEIFDKNVKNSNVDIGYLPVKEKKIPIINTWHFSCPGKGFEKCFYEPIVRSCKEFFKMNL